MDVILEEPVRGISRTGGRSTHSTQYALVGQLTTVTVTTVVTP